jgi:hypothetical protein
MLATIEVIDVLWFIRMTNIIRGRKRRLSSRSSRHVTPIRNLARLFVPESRPACGDRTRLPVAVQPRRAELPANQGRELPSAPHALVRVADKDRDAAEHRASRLPIPRSHRASVPCYSPAPPLAHAKRCAVIEPSIEHECRHRSSIPRPLQLSYRPYPIPFPLHSKRDLAMEFAIQ